MTPPFTIQTSLSKAHEYKWKERIPHANFPSIRLLEVATDNTIQGFLRHPFTASWFTLDRRWQRCNEIVVCGDSSTATLSKWQIISREMTYHTFTDPFPMSSDRMQYKYVPFRHQHEAVVPTGTLFAERIMKCFFCLMLQLQINGPVHIGSMRLYSIYCWRISTPRTHNCLIQLTIVIHA